MGDETRERAAHSLVTSLEIAEDNVVQCAVEMARLEQRMKRASADLNKARAAIRDALTTGVVTT